MAHIAASHPPHNINEEKSTLERMDKLRGYYNGPASGRTTALGRRVEKPGTGKQAGPSGQRDLGKVDGKHANK